MTGLALLGRIAVLGRIAEGCSAPMRTTTIARVLVMCALFSPSAAAITDDNDTKHCSGLRRLQMALSVRAIPPTCPLPPH